MKRYILCLMILNVFFVCITNAQMITTIAGGGTAGLGDGGAAIDCELFQPYFTAFDLSGNLYIADQGNNRVRKINSSGVITTVAGTGIAGFDGDGFAATNAKINEPLGLATDAHGNLFFSDNANHRIRKVDPSGVITTVAGNGSTGFGGDGLAATATSLYSPHGIAVDNFGNIYICDVLNERLRKVDASGIINTVAGTGAPGIFIEGALATTSAIGQPFGVTIDESGNIFFAAQSAHRVYKVNLSGIISTVAGTGSFGYNGDNIAATTAKLNGPFNVSLDKKGNIYIADVVNSRIRRVNDQGIITTVAGKGVNGYSGDGGPATDAEMKSPVGVTCDKYGSIYISDFGNDRIRFIKNTLTVERKFPITGVLSVYPNPNDGRFFMNIRTGTEETASITVSDLLGRIVTKMNERTNREVAVNLREYPEGVYVLSVMAPSLKATHERILIKH